MQKNKFFYLLLPWQNETLLCALKRVLQYPIKVQQFVCYKKACIFGRLIQPRQYLIQHRLLPFKIKCYLKKKFDEFRCANFSQFYAFSRSQTFSPFCKKSVHREFQYITNFTQKVNWKISFLCSYLRLYL